MKHRIAVSLLLLLATSQVYSLTDHFNKWLEAQGLGSFDFQREDLGGASYGGKSSDSDVPTKTPIVFVHGNSDRGIGTSGWQIGFQDAINYLLQNGYNQSELYVTTWGPADQMKAYDQYHSRDYINRTRVFIQAVLQYTNSTKVNVVGHSMGVTLGRKAIKGGNATDPYDGGDYNLGPSIAAQVDNFIGVAGANWGLMNCLVPFAKTCDETVGFYPGIGPGPIDLSKILDDINKNGGKEAGYVFTYYSLDDDLIGYNDLVWGKLTSQIPTQDAELPESGYNWTHLAMRDTCGPVVLNVVSNHSLSGYRQRFNAHVADLRARGIGTWYGNDFEEKVPIDFPQIVVE